jgi:hypothetical protein
VEVKKAGRGEGVRNNENNHKMTRGLSRDEDTVNAMQHITTATPFPFAPDLGVNNNILPAARLACGSIIDYRFIDIPTPDADDHIQ